MVMTSPLFLKTLHLIRTVVSYIINDWVITIFFMTGE